MTPTVTIPRTDLQVFPLNLGANPFGWTADRDTTFAILDTFLAAGGNFIDTADMYSVWVSGHHGGESETLIGQWLRARDARDRVIIATKGGTLAPHRGLGRHAVLAAVDASRERLGVDTIDLYYYHHDDERTSIPEQVATATELITSGRIRHLALSNHSPERTREFLSLSHGTPAHPVALQPQYNLLHRREVEEDYGPLATAHDLALLPYFSLASGMLTGKYRHPADLDGVAREGFLGGYDNPAAFRVVDTLVETARAHAVEPATVALAWLLAKGVSAPIASVSTPEQLPALMAAPELTLSPAELNALDEVSAAFRD